VRAKRQETCLFAGEKKVEKRGSGVRVMQGASCSRGGGGGGVGISDSKARVEAGKKKYQTCKKELRSQQVELHREKDWEGRFQNPGFPKKDNGAHRKEEGGMERTVSQKEE